MLERHIGDDTEHILAVTLIESHGLLIVTRKHNFWTAAHAQHLLMLI